MDGRNGFVNVSHETSPKDMPPTNRVPYSTATMYARVPSELKYLIVKYQQHQKLMSFSNAVQRLLETHPDLARLAAELYNASSDAHPDGPDNPSE